MTGTDINRVFGERVHYERTRLGWTMRELGAKAGGFEPTSVMRAEKGTTDIHLSTAVRLAVPLQISLDGLISQPACLRVRGEAP